MNAEHKILDTLIATFLAGEATPAQRERLAQWIGKSDDNLRCFMAAKNAWEITHPAFPPETIDTRKACRAVVDKIGLHRKSVRIGKLLRYWQQTAAVLLLPLLGLSAYLLFDRPARTPVVWQKAIAPYGMRSKVSLPDGSQVWLNAGSTIRYPVPFEKTGRRVEMEGEAYFAVESNPTNPFIVKAPGFTVRATGTAFNVEAYPGEETASITLAEGVVDVAIGGKSVTLQPRERLIYNRATCEHGIYLGDTFKWTSWKDGILAFRNDPLCYVFKRLEQTYNVDFVIRDPDIENYIYHATFEGESLDEILNLLERSAPIVCRKSGQRKVENDLYQKQTIEVVLRGRR